MFFPIQVGTRTKVPWTSFIFTQTTGPQRNGHLGKQASNNLGSKNKHLDKWVNSQELKSHNPILHQNLVVLTIFSK